MRPHLRYLRYVLLHKWYVLVGGLQIHGWRPSWVWRLLVHDLSKFRPSEWRPYVAMFYGEPLPPGPFDDIERTKAVAAEKQKRKREFDAAWLAHQHRNAHHWQHWVLREDDGATKVLVPPVACVDEMVADWIGAGSKILTGPSVSECIGLTGVWYLENRERIMLRQPTRERVEAILLSLLINHQLPELVLALQEAAKRTVTFTIQAPQHGGLARVEADVNPRTIPGMRG